MQINQHTLIHGHSVVNNSLGQNTYSLPNRLNELNPSLLKKIELVAEGASVTQPNFLQIGSAIEAGGALVGHELESISVSERSSSQSNSSFDAQEDKKWVLR